MFRSQDHLQGSTLFLAKVTFLKTLTDKLISDLLYLSNEPTSCTKFLFYNKFISFLYMFREHVLIIRRSTFHYTASGIIKPASGRLVHRLRVLSQPVGVMIPEAV